MQGADGNLYGITQGGGNHLQGKAFSMTRSGTLTTFYNFLLAEKPNALCGRFLRQMRRCFKVRTETSMEHRDLPAKPLTRVLCLNSVPAAHSHCCIRFARDRPAPTARRPWYR